MLTEFPGRPEKEIILEIMMIHLLFKRKIQLFLLFLLILLMMSFNDQKESGFLKCHTPLFNVIVLRQKCKEKIFNLTCLHLYFGNIYMSL